MASETLPFLVEEPVSWAWLVFWPRRRHEASGFHPTFFLSLFSSWLPGGPQARWLASIDGV